MELQEVITELQNKIELNNKIIKIIPNIPDVSEKFVNENELFNFIINVLQKGNCKNKRQRAKKSKGVIKMGLVVIGTVICVIAVMIMAFLVICLTNMAISPTDEVGNTNTLFALILGLILMTSYGLGVTMVQMGMTEQQTIQVESGDMNDK